MSSILDGPEQAAVSHDRDAFNLAVWDKLIDDPAIAQLSFRIETDEHGQIIISPIAPQVHGHSQAAVGILIGDLVSSGNVITECPVSTSKGVKIVDVAWCSDELCIADKDNNCFTSAPAICVEVISPSNAASEIAEKKTAYFEKEAEEVWLVATDGAVEFFLLDAPDVAVAKSGIVPDFPETI